MRSPSSSSISKGTGSGRKVSLLYTVARRRPFDPLLRQFGSVRTGSTWAPLSESYGQYQFSEIGDKVFVSWPADTVLKDMGEGALQKTTEALNKADIEQSFPRKLQIETGHVYLVYRPDDERWLAFQVEIE